MPKNKRNIFIFCLLAVFVVILGLYYIWQNNQKEKVARQNESNGQPRVLGIISNPRGPDELRVYPKFAQKGELNLSKISAKSFLAYDPLTSQILLEKSANIQIPIASLTKLLTALVAYEKLDLGSEIEISIADTMDISPSLKLQPGEKVKVLDLFNAMLIGSNNDAALALANHAAKATNQNFVNLMNKKAKDLGMSYSKFSNPLGFDSKENFSTAKDLVLLINNLEKLAVIKNLGKQTSYKFISKDGNSYFTESTNKLIKTHSDLEAIKTGFTSNSLGSMISRLNFQGRQIILIVLNSSNREKDTLLLKDQITQNFSLQ